MFRWEVQTFGLHSHSLPSYMKATNLLLHCIASCLVLIVLSRLFSFVNEVPAMAALMFAVHPVHTEAVSGIVGRADLLCAVFYLLVLLMYEKMVKPMRTKLKMIGYWVAISGMTFFALLCKETGITVLVWIWADIAGEFVLYASDLQPMCLVIEMLSVVEMSHLKDVRKNVERFLNSQMAIRWSLLICITIVLVFLRLWIMNFEQPTFKPMDNPIAASEQLLTRVSTKWLFHFNRLDNKN